MIKLIYQNNYKLYNKDTNKKHKSCCKSKLELKINIKQESKDLKSK
jgi:hypothetical protein